MRGRRKRRRCPPSWEMELDEVRLTKYWSIKVTTPKPGEVKVYLLMCDEHGATVNLKQDELRDAAEGFRAVAEVLEEAVAVDEPISDTDEDKAARDALSGRFVPEEFES